MSECNEDVGANVSEDVKDYYTNALQVSTDLKTNACCTSVKYPKYIRDIMSNIHDDVIKSYYGCGLVIPDCLEGCKTIDIGCGTGRDVYILSKLVGDKGSVIGIDMTYKQIDIAESFVDYHKELYGYKNSNVSFILTNIDTSKIYCDKNNLCDVIVSNCVINLVQNKEVVLNKIYNLLKDGGEFYFSDVYSDRRIPQELRDNKVLWGECLSGALYWNDFLQLARKCGFIDPRLVESSVITVENKELEKEIERVTGERINFYSATYRLFKLPSGLLEQDCENYGQSVIYNGGIQNNEEEWSLDNHHTFKKNESVAICGNTFNMLKYSRFRKYFSFKGDMLKHYGIFPDCGKNIPFANDCSSFSGCC